MPDHHCIRLCPSADLLLFSPQWFQIQICVWCQMYMPIACQITFKLCWYRVCITPWGHITLFCISSSWFVYFSAWTGFSIITWNDVDSAQVCFSITLLQLLMVWILRVYIAQKNERGENSMCHKKYQNPVSHLRLGPIHISRVWYT